MKRTLTMAVLILAALSLAPALAAEEVIERYNGFAVAMGSTVPGTNSSIEVGIYRWSTEEERVGFLTVLRDKGSEALHKAMFDAEQVAFLKVSGSMGYKLKFAREFVDQKGMRHIILAADRPVTVVGMRRSTKANDYDFTFIELTIDEEGKGEGALALGVEVAWNKEKDVPELTSYSSEPMRITTLKKAKN
jgi:hypothetical protein